MVDPTYNNICVVIVTYEPEILLQKSVEMLLPNFNYIILIDNHSRNEKSNEILNSFRLNSKIQLIRNSENKGLAFALNQGIKVAIEKNYFWVLTLDQDSLPTINLKEILINSYNSSDKSKIGLIGVNYSTNRSISYQISNVFRLNYPLVIITSGSMLSTEAYKKTGDFFDQLFIDCVDFDYCLRLRLSGFRIVANSMVGLIHQCGNESSVKVFGKEFFISNHSPIRRYYMARNNQFLVRKYFWKFPFWIIKKNYFFYGSVFKIILFENNKFQKLKNVGKGLLAGIFFK